MKKIVETERLILREWGPDDAPIFFELNLDPEVMKYTGDVAFESVEKTRTFLENYTHYEEYGMGRWLVILKDTQEAIGWCGLKYHPCEEYVDLGYRFFRKHWGRGYATEAGIACIEYGFQHLGLEEVVGRTARLNKGSVRVLEKIGMTYWKNEACEGIKDSVYYRIVK